VGRAVDDHLQRIAASPESGVSTSTSVLGAAGELDDGLGEVQAPPSAARPGSPSDHQVIRAQLTHCLGKVSRLQRIERPGIPLLTSQKRHPLVQTSPSASRWRCAAPAFADVRAARLLADGVEVQLAQGGLTCSYRPPPGMRTLSQSGWARAPGAAPAELDQRVGHEGAV